MKERVLFSWSGGKDSALALHEVLQSAQYDVAGLLTTVTTEYDRISIHGVRRALLREQAESLGIPIQEVEIPPKTSNEDYEAQWEAALRRWKTREPGFRTVVFGDIFLEDVRAYREKQLARMGLRGIFPLWGKDTRELAGRFQSLGFKAVLVCVDTTLLPPALAGREYDHALIQDLPPGADPCGEKGEFHTFVYDGPIFTRPIPHTRGERVLREGRFMYCDLN
ncbi:MAG: adenine nucleotide alpha hydrolase [Elusimicrobia bacterium]|nr:adenine nucleotide alpha hydrolase [Elusimicrobiota bacterium]